MTEPRPFVRQRWTFQLALVMIGWLGHSPTMQASELIEVFTEPYRSIEVAAHEQGTIDKIAVRLGDIVQQGATIAHLNRDVLLASLQVAKARANLTAARQRAAAELRLTQRRYEKTCRAAP